MASLLMMVAASMLVAAIGGGNSGGGGGMAVAAQDVSARLVFPSADDIPPLVTNTTPTCINETRKDIFCEDDNQYDDRIKRRVAALLQQDPSVNNLLSSPSLRNLLSDVVPPVDVSIRTGTVSERPVCAAQETLIYPRRAKNMQDEWVFVLNQEGVQQALRVEKCIQDGSSCSLGMTLPGGATATCRQKYVYRRVLVLGTNAIEPEEVFIPSCCVCYTTYEGLFTRSGPQGGNRRPMSPAVPAQGSRTPMAAQPVASPGVAPSNFRSFRRPARSHGRTLIRFPRGRYYN